MVWVVFYGVGVLAVGVFSGRWEKYWSFGAFIVRWAAGIFCYVLDLCCVMDSHSQGVLWWTNSYCI